MVPYHVSLIKMTEFFLLDDTDYPAQKVNSLTNDQRVFVSTECYGVLLMPGQIADHFRHIAT